MEPEERLYLFIFLLNSLPTVNDGELWNTNPELLLLSKDQMEQRGSKCLYVNSLNPPNNPRKLVLA